jgi:hypothetical protein
MHCRRSMQIAAAGPGLMTDPVDYRHVDLNENDRALRNSLGMFPDMFNGIVCHRGRLEAVRIDLK